MKWWQYLSLFVFASSELACLGLLPQLSKDEGGKFAYSMPGVVFVAESCKFAISASLLVWQEGGLRAFWLLLRRIPPRSWLPFAVPSLLYGVNNNLDMFCNLYMDSATFQVMMQMKVLTTGSLWRLVFRQSLSWRKWQALMLLACGGACASAPSGGGPGMMSITPVGVLLMCLYCTNSALASVSTEFVYKRFCAHESIHLQNLAMYTFGMMGNFLMYRASEREHVPSAGLFVSLFHGYNFWTWCMVANYASLGFVVAFVMKRLSNIHKLLMSGASMYVSAIFTCLLFGLLPTPMYTLGLSVVSVALATFHSEEIAAIWPRGRPKATSDDLDMSV